MYYDFDGDSAKSPPAVRAACGASAFESDLSNLLSGSGGRVGAGGTHTSTLRDWGGLSLLLGALGAESGAQETSPPKCDTSMVHKRT